MKEDNIMLLRGRTHVLFIVVVVAGRKRDC